MSVTIRLSRHGRTKRPFYRIVVCDKEFPRDGRYLEVIGTVNPLIEPAKVELKQDRVKYWIGVGANPSDTVASIISKEIPGYLEDIEKTRLERVRSRRAKRKAAGKGAAKEKSEAKARRKARAKREKPEPPKKQAAPEEAAEAPAETEAQAEEAKPEETAAE